MRELIKNGNYSFTNGSRQITVTDGRSFTAHDVISIFNQTQKIVLVAELQKDNIVSVAGGVITYSNSLPVLATGDELSIYVDFPQKEYTVTTHTQYFNFTALQGTFLIQQPGTLVSVTDATALLIRRINTNMYVQLTLPATVSVGDSIAATVSSTGNKSVVIQKNSTSDSVIQIGSLGSKTVGGCGNFAYYSPALSKILIGGLAVLTENMEFINGDGSIGYTSNANSETTYNSHALEYNGYLYYYSVERSSMIRVNLSTGIVQTLGVNYLPTKLFVSNGYLYIDCRNPTGTSQFIYGIDLVTLSTFNVSYTSGNAGLGSQNGISILGSDGSVYFMYNTQYLAKYAGSTYTQGTVGTGLNYPEIICNIGSYIYGANNTSLRKYNTSDCNLVASITFPTPCYTLFSNYNDTKLFCINASGTVYRIDVASFTRDTAVSYSLGIASSTSMSAVKYGNYMYLFSGSGAGTTTAQTFIRFNLTTEEITVYSPANGNGLSLNTHNAMNIDPINNRLIFYAVNRNAISQTNVEIVNIP